MMSTFTLLGKVGKSHDVYVYAFGTSAHHQNREPALHANRPATQWTNQ